jgi:hypothetical protein
VRVYLCVCVCVCVRVFLRVLVRTHTHTHTHTHINICIYICPGHDLYERDGMIKSMGNETDAGTAAAAWNRPSHLQGCRPSVSAFLSLSSFTCPLPSPFLLPFSFPPLFLPHPPSLPSRSPFLHEPLLPPFPPASRPLTLNRYRLKPDPDHPLPVPCRQSQEATMTTPKTPTEASSTEGQAASRESLNYSPSERAASRSEGRIGGEGKSDESTGQVPGETEENGRPWV